MKDKIQWLLVIISVLLQILGYAYIFLEMRRLGPYGGPTLLLGVIPVFAGLAMVVIAGRRAKKTG